MIEKVAIEEVEFHIKRQKTKMLITPVKFMQITSYLDHNTILRKEIYPENLIEI